MTMITIIIVIALFPLYYIKTSGKFLVLYNSLHNLYLTFYNTPDFVLFMFFFGFSSERAFLMLHHKFSIALRAVEWTGHPINFNFVGLEPRCFSYTDAFEIIETWISKPLSPPHKSTWMLFKHFHVSHLTEKHGISQPQCFTVYWVGFSLCLAETRILLSPVHKILCHFPLF